MYTYVYAKHREWSYGRMVVWLYCCTYCHFIKPFCNAHLNEQKERRIRDRPQTKRTPEKT